MKLELKHISPYIPYGLEFKSNDKICKLGEVIVGMNTVVDWGSSNHFINNIKPLLRPLSSITIEEAYELGVIITSEADMEDMEVGVGGINIFGEYYTTISYQDKVDKEFSFVVQFSSIGIAGLNPITYEVYTWLFKNHFDVFGLIEQGLAIDKTTFK